MRAGEQRDRTVGALEAVLDTFDHLPLMALGFTGPEHRYDAANAAFRALTGRSDVVGLPVREAFPELATQQLLDVLDRVYAGGASESVREWRLQVTLASGELEELYADITVAPRRADDGSVGGVAALCVDVTARVHERRAEQQRTTEAEQRYRAARDVVVELQAALMPTGLPVLPRADVAARYLVAGHDQAAGGDWFDAIPLADGRLALLVGDVVGHGVTASAAMGRLRAVIEELLVSTGGDLVETLARADRVAERTPAMRATTVCAGVLDPVTGAFRYSTCGHPPPLAVTLDGTHRFLPATGGGPLGTGAAPSLATGELRDDEVLVLYSDGLVERVGRTLDEGLAGLARVAADAAANRVMPVAAPESAAARVCEQSVELLTRAGHDDDVTALAVQRRPAPTTLRLDAAAGQSAVSQARRVLLDWLQALGASPRDQQSLELAVAELVANVVAHSYPADRPGRVRVCAELGADGTALVEVSDDGRWREPRVAQQVGGRGLWLAGAMVDGLSLARAATAGGPGVGTVATVRHRLRRPAALASAPASSDRPAAAYATDVEEGPAPVLRVHGPVDFATAERFADDLAGASRGGLHPLTVDLTAVPVLASAGVSALFSARDQHTTHGHALTLVAASGTPARRVLELVGLDVTDQGTA